MKEMASKEESQRLFRVDKVVLPFPQCLKILTFVVTSRIIFFLNQKEFSRGQKELENYSTRNENDGQK